MYSFSEQVQRNSVALISLVVAVSALAYNTWRNETTEEQRNIRHAAFRVLENLGEMQEIVDARYYFKDATDNANTGHELHLRGYGSAAMSRDLMNLMPPPAPAAGHTLHAAWLEYFPDLDDQDAAGGAADSAVAAEEAIRTSLVDARSVVIEVLAGLD